MNKPFADWEDYAAKAIAEQRKKTQNKKED
jgi:hypothetical protein